MSGALQAVFQNLRSFGAPTFFANLYPGRGRSTFTDSSGSIFVSGIQDLTNVVQIAKYDTSGNLQFQKKSDLTSDQRMLLDNSGNILVSRGGGSNLSVQKLDSLFNYIWQVNLTGWPAGVSGVNVSSGGICSDSSGNVYATALVQQNCLYSLVVAKFNSSGALQFSTTLTDNYQPTSRPNIVVASSGSIYVSATSPPQGTLIKLNSSGTIVFRRTITNATTSCKFSDLVIDASENIYLSGQYLADGVRFFSDCGMVVKYNSSGTLQWHNVLDYGVISNFLGIGIDSAANVYLTGQLATDNSIPLVKYNSSGTIQWQRNFSSSARNSVGQDMAVAADGNPVFVGATDAASLDNRFIFGKFPENGSKTGTYTLSALSWIYAATSGTSSTPGGAVYGSTTGTQSSISLSSTATSNTTTTSSLTTGTVIL